MSNVAFKNLVYTTAYAIILVAAAVCLAAFTQGCSSPTAPDSDTIAVNSEQGLQMELARRRDQGRPTIGVICWHWFDGMDLKFKCDIISADDGPL